MWLWVVALRIAVVGGTGGLGFGLVLRLAKAGYRVALGSRSREKALRTAEDVKGIIGPAADIRGCENSEAVEDADVVMLSIPFEGVEAIARSVKQHLTPGAVVVSCIVPLGSETGENSSAAEYVASLLTGLEVEVVAAYHTVSAEKLREIDKPLACDTLIVGDNKEAKRKIAEITYGIEGLRPVDAGPLKNARIVEKITALLISINRKYKIRDAGIRVTGLEDEEVRRRWQG